MSHKTIAVAAALVLAACGGAADLAPKSPESNAPSEPTSVEEAQAQIARAQQEIGGARAVEASSTMPSSDAKREPPPPPPPAPPMTPNAAKPADVSPKPQATSDTDRCQSPCRAIASMRRAVGALCRMTGDDDARCTDAKKTLAESESRVAPCGC